MKKSIITSMLMLCAMSGWAQGTKTPVNDSICVFDGTVTGVPDGTVVYLALPIREHPGAYKPDTITTVKGGKFPNTHIHSNPEMRRRGITCAQDEKFYE